MTIIVKMITLISISTPSATVWSASRKLLPGDIFLPHFALIVSGVTDLSHRR